MICHVIKCRFVNSCCSRFNVKALCLQYCDFPDPLYCVVILLCNSVCYWHLCNYLHNIHLPFHCFCFVVLPSGNVLLWIFCIHASVSFLHEILGVCHWLIDQHCWIRDKKWNHGVNGIIIFIIYFLFQFYHTIWYFV